MGNVDIYHSRRNNYTECEYWVRDERDAIGSPQEWILKNKSNGTFFAKTVSNKVNQQNQIQGVWMLDSNFRTIESDDHIEGIKRGCIVKYRGELYMVESVQERIHLKESEFNTEEEFKTVISMRK